MKLNSTGQLRNYYVLYILICIRCECTQCTQNRQRKHRQRAARVILCACVSVCALKRRQIKAAKRNRIGKHATIVAIRFKIFIKDNLVSTLYQHICMCTCKQPTCIHTNVCIYIDIEKCVRACLCVRISFLLSCVYGMYVCTYNHVKNRLEDTGNRVVIGRHSGTSGGGANCHLLSKKKKKRAHAPKVATKTV